MSPEVYMFIKIVLVQCSGPDDRYAHNSDMVSYNKIKLE